LIDSCYIEIGGVAVQSGLTQYNNLFNIFRDFQLWDKKKLRGILQNDSNTAQTADSSVIGTVGNGKPFAIYNWLGLLGSVKVLDTTLMPPVKIYLRLAPNAVVSVAGGGTGTYQLTNVAGSIDILDVADGVYYNMVAQRLQSAPLEIPFSNYTTIMGSAGSVAQSLRWSTSAHCVEKVIGTLLPANYTTQGAQNATTLLAPYFTRKGDLVSYSQYFVNGVPYPSIPLDNFTGEVFIDTVHSLGVSQDAVAQTNENMDTLTKFNANFWTHIHSFTYLDDPDEHRLTGLDGRGNAILGQFETKGVGDSVIPLLWVCHTSLLRIGANKMVELVL
jgi:hypothetical protein